MKEDKTKELTVEKTETVSVRTYEKELRALLEALEIQKIDEILNDIDKLVEVGKYITVAAKLGAPLVQNY